MIDTCEVESRIFIKIADKFGIHVDLNRVLLTEYRDGTFSGESCNLSIKVPKYLRKLLLCTGIKALRYDSNKILADLLADLCGKNYKGQLTP